MKYRFSFRGSHGGMKTILYLVFLQSYKHCLSWDKVQLTRVAQPILRLIVSANYQPIQ